MRVIIYFTAVITLIRIFLLFVPVDSWMYTDEFHHIYIGFILLGIYLAGRKLRKYDMVFLYAAALAMIADEALFMFTGNYWSTQSLLGAFIISSLVVGYYARAYRRKRT